MQLRVLVLASAVAVTILGANVSQAADSGACYDCTYDMVWIGVGTGEERELDGILDAIHECQMLDCDACSDVQPCGWEYDVDAWSPPQGCHHTGGSYPNRDDTDPYVALASGECGCTNSGEPVSLDVRIPLDPWQFLVEQFFAPRPTRPVRAAATEQLSVLGERIGVLESNLFWANVTGKVTAPGTYALRPPMLLRQLIAKAGGFTADVTDVRVVRRRDTRTEVISVTLRNYQRTDGGVLLMPGDRVIVR
jgi:hypothetical protein